MDTLLKTLARLSGFGAGAFHRLPFGLRLCFGLGLGKPTGFYLGQGTSVSGNRVIAMVARCCYILGCC